MKRYGNRELSRGSPMALGELLFIDIPIVFEDQASVNMQEMALMQAGRETGKG